MTFKKGDFVIDQTTPEGYNRGVLTGITKAGNVSVFKVLTWAGNVIESEKIALDPTGEDDYNHFLLSRGLKRYEHSESQEVEPSYYDFPQGIEVRHISAHLTSFGGQALQYVARATRLDGRNKGNPIEDLMKALDFIQWEIDRLREVE